MPGGRPPAEYKPEYCQIAIKMMQEGAAKIELCHELGVSNNTFDRWLNENPEFLNAFNEAKELAEGWWTKVGRGNLANRDFNSRLYEINMMNRFGWMKKAQGNHNVMVSQAEALKDLD